MNDICPRCKKEKTEIETLETGKEIKSCHKCLERAKKYREFTKEENRERSRQYRANNKEKKKIANKKYREENKELTKKRDKEKYYKNRDAILEQKKEYHLEHKEDHNERCKQYYHENKHKPYFVKYKLLRNAKLRSIKHGIEFTITKDDLVLEEPYICTCCGRTMTVNEKIFKDDSITLDKIIPLKGYVPGNVAIICFRCNSLKTDATYEELFNLVEYMKRYID